MVGRGQGPWIVLASSALACLAVCLAFPVANPDLFWHLSAGRRILEEFSIPRADWLSSTLEGAPWVDFEWACQALYESAFRAGGMPAILGLKAAVLLGAAAVLHAVFALYRLSRPARAAGTALWACGMLAVADAKPEQFSVLGLSAVFFLLERWRLEGRCPPWWAWGALFAAWSNLHPGFVLGLALIALYAGAGVLEGLGWLARGDGGPPGDRVRPVRLYGALAAAFFGTLFQPVGLVLYGVIWRHGGELGSVGRLIAEWAPPGLANPWYWPFWAVLLAGALGAWARARSRTRIAAGPLAAWVVLALAAALCGKLAPYFTALGVPLALRWDTGWSEPRERAASWRLACVGLLLASFAGWGGATFGAFRRVFDDRFVPVAAADFLDKHAAELSGLRLYNTWTWGGYLGWRLHPRLRVFQDGRYIFHGILRDEEDAFADPSSWRNFLDLHGIDVAVVDHGYDLLMEGGRWRAVYSDPKAVVYLRRR